MFELSAVQGTNGSGAAQTGFAPKGRACGCWSPSSWCRGREHAGLRTKPPPHRSSLSPSTRTRVLQGEPPHSQDKSRTMKGSQSPKSARLKGCSHRQLSPGMKGGSSFDGKLSVCKQKRRQANGTLQSVLLGGKGGSGIPGRWGGEVMLRVGSGGKTRQHRVTSAPSPRDPAEQAPSATFFALENGGGSLQKLLNSRKSSLHLEGEKLSSTLRTEHLLVCLQKCHLFSRSRVLCWSVNDFSTKRS